MIRKLLIKLAGAGLIIAIGASSVAYANSGGMGAVSKAIHVEETSSAIKTEEFGYVVAQPEDSVNIWKLNEYCALLEALQDADTKESETEGTQEERTSAAEEMVVYYPTDSILQTSGNPSQSDISLCSQELAKIPQTLKDRFVADGWNFTLTTADLGDTFFRDGQSYQGVTVYETRQILVEDRSNAIKGATIHEFGHYVGCVSAGVTAFGCDQEWSDIYWVEGANCGSVGMDSYGQTNPIEYFAECFVWYCERPGDLQTYLPQSYSYLSNKINTYFYGG